MKCIFLDFDGVINNWNHFTGVSEDNARVLKHIINITAAKVIVTSSNKYELQRNDTKEYYASNFYKEYVKILLRKKYVLHVLLFLLFSFLFF